MDKDKIKKIKDMWHKLRLWVGFNLLGWHEPEGFEWGYFYRKCWYVRKYRDVNGLIHENSILLPKGKKLKFDI